MMNKILLLLLFSGSSLYATAQASFPKSFTGSWKGILEWFSTGKNEPQKIDVELDILPLKDSSGRYTWRLVYSKTAKGNRPYILTPVDTAAGHWEVDEQNGIVIDQYWTGNQFCGAFTVQDATIVNNYRMEGDTLVMELTSYAAKPISTSGQGTKENPLVNCYSIQAYQRAVLHRIDK